MSRRLYGFLISASARVSSKLNRRSAPLCLLPVITRYLAPSAFVASTNAAESRANFLARFSESLILSIRIPVSFSRRRSPRANLIPLRRMTVRTLTNSPLNLTRLPFVLTPQADIHNQCLECRPIHNQCQVLFSLSRQYDHSNGLCRRTAHVRTTSANLRLAPTTNSPAHHRKAPTHTKKSLCQSPANHPQINTETEREKKTPSDRQEYLGVDWATLE